MTYRQAILVFSLYSYAHWSFNFYVMGFLGFVFLGFIRFFPLIECKKTPSFRIADFKKILTDRTFLFFSSVVALSHLCTIAFFTLAPFYFFSKGYSPVMSGIYIGVTSLGYMIGSLILSALSHRVRSDSLLLTGWCLCVGAGLFTILTSFSIYTVQWIVAMQCVFAFGKAFLVPISQTKALYHFQQNRAKAASLYNFIVTGGPIVGSLMGAFIPSTTTPLFLGLLVAGMGIINLSFFA